MDQIFVSPSRYVQGKGLMYRAGEYMEHYGRRVLVLSDGFVQELAANDMIDYLGDSYDVTKVTFNGECSFQEIDRVSQIAEDSDIDFVLGMGAGKTLDTSKAVANRLGVPVVVFPTLASTDAPTSGLSVIYTEEEGAFEDYLFFKKNPELVLMDTQIIAKAPSRMLTSGISDALATLIEARAVEQSNGNNMVGGKGTLAGWSIANTCEQVLFDYGIQAYASNKQQVVTPALEAIVEANTLLSGLGFEDCGLAAAHAVHNGFTAVKGDIHHLTHGEKVAYGSMTQLVLQNYSINELERYIDFYLQLDLPLTLEEMHLDKLTEDELYQIGEAATAPGETMDNMPFNVTADDVVQAIKAVDAYVKDYKNRHRIN